MAALSVAFEAVQAGAHDLLEGLLTENPSWVGRTLKGITLLEVAVHTFSHVTKSLEVVDTLLRHGANVNQLSVCYDVQNGSETPLIAAARKVKGRELVSKLIQVGARVNTVDGVAQYTALSYACMVSPHDKMALGALDIVKELLSNGAMVNGAPGERSPPLHLAVNKADNLPMVQLLLSFGADINQKDNSEQVALHKVVSPDVATILIQNGAVLLPETRCLFHPIEAVIASRDKRLFHVRLEIVRMMIEHGVSLNVKMIPDACRYFYQYYPRFLMDYGALQIHGPWKPRGLVEPADERDWSKISQFAREFVPDMANDRELVCKRFFWDYRDIVERFSEDNVKVMVDELYQNPPPLQERCTTLIRHILFVNSGGRSIIPALNQMELPYKMRHLVMRAAPR